MGAAGMNKAAGETSSPTRVRFHGPAVVSADGKTLVMAFSPGLVILDISDPSKQPRSAGSISVRRS